VNSVLGKAVSPDCTVPASALPANVTRVYIGLRNGIDGSGNSAGDARDGSSADSFDGILRCYAEGCGQPKVENLIVCLGPGTFSTKGAYDTPVGGQHQTPRGFTLGNGWKIHGQGADTTTLQLSAYLPSSDPATPQPLPPGTAANVVLSTSNTAVSGVEISGVTVDANYPALKQQAIDEGISALNLEAIHLWTTGGNNWIHDVSVINAAGEIGALDERFETLTVMINSGSTSSLPPGVTGNVIENVTISQFGGGAATAIALGNTVAEVKNNLVDGYQIGYGGWMMGPAIFHDNVAQGTDYGFNVDALANHGVNIVSNKISARKYGIVIGGAGVYNNLLVSNNTIHMAAGVTGIILQGGVTHTTVSGNVIVSDTPAAGATAILNFLNLSAATPNSDNVYQSNQIDSQLQVVFQAPSLRTLNCAFGNHDEHGNPRPDLPDTASTPCVP
jgi:hypothetical protein